MLIEKIKETRQFYIYGAQVVAYGAYVAIKALCGRVPAAFLVGRSVWRGKRKGTLNHLLFRV